METLKKNEDINRVQFVFEDKTSEEIGSLLKSHGFNRAPSQDTLQRQITLKAIRISKDFVSKLEGI